jgi:hypothetical protein
MGRPSAPSALQVGASSPHKRTLAPCCAYLRAGCLALAPRVPILTNARPRPPARSSRCAGEAPTATPGAMARPRPPAPLPGRRGQRDRTCVSPGSGAALWRMSRLDSSRLEYQCSSLRSAVETRVAWAMAARARERRRVWTLWTGRGRTPVFAFPSSEASPCNLDALTLCLDRRKDQSFDTLVQSRDPQQRAARIRGQPAPLSAAHVSLARAGRRPQTHAALRLMHGADSWPRATMEARHRDVEAAAADRVVRSCSSRVAELRAGGTREAAVSSARGATRGTTRACATRERTTSCTQGLHTRAEQARTGAHEVGRVEKSCVRDEMSTRGASADHRQHELAASTTWAGGGESPSAQIGSAWLHRHRACPKVRWGPKLYPLRSVPEG